MAALAAEPPNWLTKIRARPPAHMRPLPREARLPELPRLTWYPLRESLAWLERAGMTPRYEVLAAAPHTAE
ncbi:hypothetical protein GCM10012275_61420 [Longimycelium tulufanense]|uniref:Uncharacterized protein n=1 Tax=Longimycelium tulufanense TaxID=907463 RepID=A0A8J3CK81_9PSEU|nr:hypothetical protein GCM10012275_61420 [Longimycelium tulufanense]